MSSFNKKITTHTNKNKINAHSQKKDFDQKKKKKSLEGFNSRPEHT